MFHPEGP